jgi:hypothetical protein
LGDKVLRRWGSKFVSTLLRMPWCLSQQVWRFSVRMYWNLR